MGTKKNKATGRDYIYDTAYESTERQKKRRAERNKIRRELEREGIVRKGDNKDVHHPRKDLKGKVKVISRHRNRSIK